MKRTLNVLLSIAVLLLVIATPAYANEKPFSTPTLHSFNEWDIVEDLENANDAVLLEYGVSRDDADAIVADYYRALNKRAHMTDKELYGLGYSSEQIELLHAYAQGKPLNNNEIRAVAATFSDYVFVSSVTNRKATFKYNWTWSQAPMVLLGDSAALLWKAVKTDGSEIDVIRFKRESVIYYYYGNTLFTTYTSAQFENIGFNGANVQIPMIYTNGDYDIYAKSGSITIGVKVDDSVTGNFAYVRIIGQYAHTTIGVGFPSISTSNPSTLSLSFTIVGSVQPKGGREAIIHSDGTWDYI